MSICTQKEILKVAGFKTLYPYPFSTPLLEAGKWKGSCTSLSWLRALLTEFVPSDYLISNWLGWGDRDELAIPWLQVSKLPFMPFASDLYICVCPRQAVWELCFSSILLCQSVVSDCGINAINTSVLLFLSNRLWVQLKAFIALTLSKLS